MVEDTLVDRKIEKGARLLEALDAAHVPIDAALWFYFPESDKWRLVIATPIEEKQGPLAAYGAFHNAAESLDPPIELGPGEVRAASRNDPIIKALWGFGVPPSDLVGRRFGGPYINGVDFQGAYLYRAPTRRRAAAR
jgi:hypothetical protein